MRKCATEMELNQKQIMSTTNKIDKQLEQIVDSLAVATNGKAAGGAGSLSQALAVEMGKEAAWRNVKARCNMAQAPVVPLWQRGVKAALRVAALLIPVAVVLFATIKEVADNGANVYTAQAEADTFALPDGSKVVLGLGSKLVFHADADGRHAELEGQGLFMVHRDEAAPFVVKARDAQVRVLGTTFCVENWPGQERVRTRVEHGKVAMSAGNSQVTLTAGLEASWDGHNLTKGAMACPKVTVGSHDMVFSGASLTQVADEILSCYHEQLKGVRNMCHEVEPTLITTSFHNQSLESVIEELNMHFDKKISLSNGYLTISD